MNPIHRAIWSKFHIKRHDNLPYTGWQGTLAQLAELFGELGFRKGVEIGTYDADYARLFCQANPDLDLLCIDTWQSLDDRDRGVVSERNQSVQKKLAPYGARVISSPSPQAVREIQNESLDFVYINGPKDFNTVMMDLLCWTPKVKPGGIVSGSEFWHGQQHGVVCAVEAFVRGNNIRPWYLAHRDKAHSWLWVN